ncbi:unnamed protein product [Oikopleura dioica]|uniref:Bromo domain-containing protein n=1 Tax=Oikopleura dioica TaxID=34765 RepID=E4YRI3_OIKDI|nr:unnamed protein product [Oikopleura dioica]
MLLWKQIAEHKYASVFKNPVKDSKAKSYSICIKSSTDLMQIRRKIEAGLIKNGPTLHRELLHLFQNAMMYNSSSSEVYRMAFEMQRDVNEQVADFIGTRMIIQAGALS